MVIDNSLARPWLDRIYFEPLIKVLPRSITPNTITLSGLVACLAMLAMLLSWKAPSAVLALVSALAIHTYTLADQLDGMQARRTSRTSALGGFLDHACDFINGQIIIWAACLLVDAGSVWLIAVSSAYTFAFLTCHLEERTSGTLHFGAVGPLEGLLAVTLFLLIYSVAPKALMTPLIAGFTAGHALLFFYIVGLGWAALSVALRLRAAFLPACGLPILAICLACAAALWSNGHAELYWLIQLGCGAIYAICSLYAPSPVVRALPVFPIGLLALAVAALVETRIIDVAAGITAASLILGYALIVLLAVAVDVRRFFAAPSG
jgi:phosphatidylglycerophosphate synthase